MPVYGHWQAPQHVERRFGKAAVHMEVWNGLGLSGATRDDPITVIQRATISKRAFCSALYSVAFSLRPQPRVKVATVLESGFGG
jgi:hypothetical protein